jgi:hypothetical protein
MLSLAAVLSQAQFARADPTILYTVTISPDVYTVEAGDTFTLHGYLSTSYAGSLFIPAHTFWEDLRTRVPYYNPETWYVPGLGAISGTWVYDDPCCTYGNFREEFYNSGYLGPTSFTGPGTVETDFRTFVVPVDARPGTYVYYYEPRLGFTRSQPIDFSHDGVGELGGLFSLNVVSEDAISTPEPSTLSLLFGGLAALVFLPLLRRCMRTYKRLRLTQS